MRSTEELPQLRVGTRWQYVDVIADPEVVISPRGYSPAIEVIRGDIRHFLFVSARSLAAGLEPLRERHGTLEGLSVRLRRTGTERTAPYEVQECK